MGHKYTVKHVNPAYTDAMRSSSPMSKKDDSYDAFCVAKILRDMLDTLPDEHRKVPSKASGILQTEYWLQVPV